MIQKLALLFLSIFLIAQQGAAQNDTAMCGFDFLNQKPATNYFGSRSDNILTIPVVVHVVHLQGEDVGVGSNISDAQVISAIDDFNNQMINNPHGDVNIRLCLANTDPDGNPTNGIDRVTWTSYYEEYGVYGVGESAADMATEFAWPKQYYYNIYTVTETDNNGGGGGVQGFAYFPTGSIVDGTYILHNAIGVVGNLKTYTNQNKTFVHEIGHGMNLYHTFQSTPSCTSETDCVTQGDRLCDTPPHFQTSACLENCPNAPRYNHMSYSNQNCRTEFTSDGIARMHAAIVNSPHRAPLLESNVCEYTEDGEYDCNNYFNGTAYIDSCGNCVGGNTELEPCIQDCAGIWGGESFIDDCGNCVLENPCILPCENDICEDAIALSWCIWNQSQNYNCNETPVSDLPTTPNVGSNCLQNGGIPKTTWYRLDVPVDAYTEVKVNSFFEPEENIYMAIFEGNSCSDLKLIFNSTHWGCCYNFLDYWQPPMTMLPPSGYGFFVTSPTHFDAVFPFVAGTYYIMIYPRVGSSGEFEINLCPLIPLSSQPTLESEGNKLIWSGLTPAFEVLKLNHNNYFETYKETNINTLAVENGIYKVRGQFNETKLVSVDIPEEKFEYECYDVVGRKVDCNRLEKGRMYYKIERGTLQRQKIIKFE